MLTIAEAIEVIPDRRARDSVLAELQAAGYQGISAVDLFTEVKAGDILSLTVK